MRIKVAALVTVAVTVSASAYAVAAAPNGDVYTPTAKASAGGSSAKPLPVAASFDFTGVGMASNARPTTPTSVSFTWQGLRENGGAFPKCTAAQIDLKQSDSGCAKGSLVATGVLKAKLGPSNDKTSNVSCTKKMNIYNGGAGKVSIFGYGSPADCAGVGYFPPIPMVWAVKSGTSVLTLPLPDQISHPLPGVEGAFTQMTLNFKKLSVRKSGKTIGYLTSVGCKGSRSFTLKVVGPTSDSSTVVKSNAGTC